MTEPTDDESPRPRRSPPPPPQLPLESSKSDAAGAPATATPKRRRTRKPKPERAPKPERKPRATREPLRPLYQLGLLTRASHPVQAILLAAAVGGVAAWDHRGWKGSLIAAAGVLLTQLALGLLNDVYDASSDARGDRDKKPIATGRLPRGNATYLAAVLVLASLPVAALNGTIAGVALLLTLPVGYLHNRILHRTPASFLGWMLTFPLLVTYLAYGGWGAGKHGNAPTWQVLVASAGLALMVHFFTALPDLASDHKAGLSELPLVIARRTGATVLLIITVILLAAAVAVTVRCGLHFGIRQR